MIEVKRIRPFWAVVDTDTQEVLSEWAAEWQAEEDRDRRSAAGDRS